MQKANAIIAKPFVKWVGGKGQILSKIENIYPTELGLKINKYVEPFVGGGAVLFNILSNYSLDEVHINDINKELINSYIQVKNNSKQLILQLEELQTKYVRLSTDERKSMYYDIRQQYNHLIINGNKIANINKAAFFIFLNKTCFNGLYRVNKKGLFNVPIGSYKNPLICDKENLMNASKLLQNVNIHCYDYKNCIDLIDENTFVYIDPPYRPLSASANFTAYNEGDFGDKEQVELSKFVHDINNLNAKAIISNSDPKNTDKDDEFFDDLYGKYNIQRITATRMVNSIAKKRGAINELLISN